MSYCSESETNPSGSGCSSSVDLDDYFDVIQNHNESTDAYHLSHFDTNFILNIHNKRREHKQVPEIETTNFDSNLMNRSPVLQPTPIWVKQFT